MASFRDTTLPLEQRTTALLAALTLDEKISLLAGRDFWRTKAIPRLGIRPFRMTDGPRGVAFHSARRRGTAFPSGIALGATWDTDLARRMGEALGREAREAGCAVLLGPAVNIVRTPLCGRTFEYFTEDPHLNSRLAVAYVEGVQSQGVAACIKHFAANNQETDRMRTSAEVDLRALREIYLPAFEAAVREADVWSVMGAYNAVNGVAACENPELLWDLLREEWGFSGFVVSDWFAGRRTRSALSCLEAGLSLEMPGRGSRYRLGHLRRQVARGRIAESDVDRVLRGLVRVMLLTGHIDAPAERRHRTIHTSAHGQLARQIAESSLTLLQNRGGVLPLVPGRLRRLAVLGPRARTRHGWPLWGGSSAVWPPYEITPARGLREVLGPDVEFVRDAARADAAVVFVGLTHRPGQDAEARDRKGLALPARQIALIRDTLRRNRHTIVVLVAGSPVSMDWADDVPAILVAWYPGMEGGRAIANALVGAANPAGKLPVTFPRSLSDSPAHRSPRSFPGDGRRVFYDEGVFVGYRHFDREGIDPLFPFGHGLSYTRFEYSDLAIRADEWEGEGSLRVAFTLANRGARAGAEVAQLYVGDPQSSLPRPPRELKAFRKVFLRPGETKRVEIDLSPRDLAFYSDAARAWVVEAGEFTVAVGGSSRDLPLAGEFRFLKDRLLDVGRA